MMHYSQELQNKYGVAGPQLGVLRIAFSNDCINLTDIANILELHITTVDGFVERLYKKNLIQQRCGYST